MKKQRLIHIRGALSLGNFGDVLLGRIMYRLVRESAPEAEIAFPGIPDEVAREVGITETERRSNVKQPDLIIFQGGGYFSQRNHSPFKWALRAIKQTIRHAAEARFRGIPYCFIGVGAGPLTMEPARQLLKYAARGARLIGVRDYASYNFFRELGVPSQRLVLGADMVLNEFAEYNDDDNEIALRRKVGLHVTEFPPVLVSGINATLAGRDDIDVKVIFDQRGEHMAAKHEAARHAFGNLWDIEEYNDCDSLLKNIGSLDGIITTKLHVGIVGVAMSKNVVAFPWHTKVSRLYDELGCPERCVPIYSADDAETIKKVIGTYFPHGTRWSGVVVPRELRQRSKLLHEIVREVVHEL